MRWWLLLTAVVLAVAGCASPGQVDGGGQAQPPRPDPAYEGRLQQQARDALARWDAALAASGGQAARAFVPVGELTELVGAWEEGVGDNNKAALMAGEVTYGSLPAAAPAAGEVRWEDGVTRQVEVLSAEQAMQQLVASGNHDCGGCRPLRVTGASLVMARVQTSRGPATAPTWEYTVEGTSARITRVAVDQTQSITVTPPPWDANNAPVGLWIESAEVSADGRRLTATFVGSPQPATGPCGTDYTGRAVESANAVVVIIDEHPYGGGGHTCNLMGATRTATVDLAVPLGDRAVLEVQQGLPVPVTKAR
jgi:hypothetical protein